MGPRRWLMLLAVTAAVGGVVAAVSPSGPTVAAGRPGPRYGAPIADPTQGSSGLATDPSVATLGDSVPAGANCSCPPFGEAYGALLAQHRGMRFGVHNFGIDGQTSASLKDELSATDSAEAQAVATAAVVTITVGANDFDETIVDSPDCADLSCYRGDLTALRTNLTAIIAAVQRLGPGRPPVILVTGYWNVFLDGAVGRMHGTAYQQASDRLTVAANLVIADATQRAAARYVDLYAPFKATGDDTGLLTDDGDHPSAAGHAVIARQLEAATPAVL